MIKKFLVLTSLFIFTLQTAHANKHHHYHHNHCDTLEKKPGFSFSTLALQLGYNHNFLITGGTIGGVCYLIRNILGDSIRRDESKIIPIVGGTLLGWYISAKVLKSICGSIMYQEDVKPLHEK